MFKNLLAEPMKITTAFVLGGLSVLGVWMLTNRQAVMRKGKCIMEEGMNMMDNISKECCCSKDEACCNE
jgi:hypothetical protein